MKDTKEEQAQKVALFRYGLIGDLIHLPQGNGNNLYALLREKAGKEYSIPGTRRTKVAPETIRHWLKIYRVGGFDALRPKERADRGASRSIPQDVQDLLLTIKDDNPAFSVPMVIDDAIKSGLVPKDVPLPASTVHRLLSRHGLMKKRTGEPTQKDHRRFEFAKAGELWMSDVMHGPSVFTEGRKKRKSYLIAFIDDATRVVPYAAFAFSENTAAFMPVLKEAIRRRGFSKRLFVDNGAAYRSHHLALVSAKLGITLVHARAHHPQAKGKIERFFRTVRGKLLPRLREHDLASLEALNRRLWAWVEGEYHQSPHRGLGDETPLDRWAQTADEVRYAGVETDLDDLFLCEAKRRVQKDRTVSLDGVVYEVDANLVDETVLLRFDPKRRNSVEVWHDGAKVQVAKPVDVRANCFVKRENKKPLALSELTQDDEEAR
jgi:transposase InsO family protein